MSNAIRAASVSKRYVVGRERRFAYTTLREALTQQAARLVRSLSSARTEAERETEFWALRGVDFEIAEGERVGIIGRNGTGKSTLLKILSRITEPTTGRIELRGRVASLLEVGTGFHPELTGRENIFLNGAVLGMTRAEIKRDFDPIVAFAEIDGFLDTPVKRYSSGMYVRLAFSVAAHLSADILLVDEVLAVGDAKFQEKCLRKMEQLTTEKGRTILFVSHNMAAIKSLCTRAIVLERGSVAFDGDVRGAVSSYASVGSTPPRRELATSTCERLTLRIPYLVDSAGCTQRSFAFGEAITLRFELDLARPVPGLELGFALLDSSGQRIFTSHLSDDPRFRSTLPATGRFTLDSDLDLPALAPGRYRIAYGAHDECGFTILYSDDEVDFEIVAAARHRAGEDGILWHTSRWHYRGEAS
jgi:lipopolysaccharide transport system ATP-binding protein